MWRMDRHLVDATGSERADRHAVVQRPGLHAVDAFAEVSLHSPQHRACDRNVLLRALLVAIEDDEHRAVLAHQRTRRESCITSKSIRSMLRSIGRATVRERESP